MSNNRIIEELKSILEKDYSHWRGLYKELLNIPNDDNHAVAGFIMEYIAKGYFINEDHYKNVWLFNEVPNKIRKELFLTDKDNGVDLVLEDKNNKYYGVQVKFRKNENSTLSWSKDKLSNLVGHRKFNGHIIFSNTAEVCKVTTTQAKDLQRILISDLLELDKTNLDSIIKILKGKPKKERVGAKPYPHQRKAIDAIKEGFKTEKRGQLILPCRAGKTITSLILKEELNAHRTIVLVPTLTLLRQFKNEWLSFRNKDFEYFCVCSDKDVDTNDISSINDIGQTGLGVSTDSDTIRGYLNTESPMVVFTTYQSLPKVCEAVKDSDIEFDLALCDEAHKTAGAKQGLFSTIHFDKNIKVNKRLYMTATPKVSSGAISKNEMTYIADMSNEKLYGKELYRMSFREAIDIGIISDYQIYACVVTDLEVATHIQERTFTKDGDAEFVASCIAVGKAMKKFNLSNIISFHSSIKRSINFIDLYKDIYNDSHVFNVNSGISTGKRALKLEEFSETPNSLMSNAKCLTEGITVKSVDAVAFADPKYSVIDIVQGASRCLNKKEDDKKGIIIVPIFVATGENMESSIEKGAFKKLVKVLRAMSDHDEDLKEEIIGVKFGEGERNSGRTGGSTIKIGKGNIIIDIESLRDEINQNIIFDEIEKKIKQASYHWVSYFNKYKQFVKTFNRNPHSREEYCNINLGSWTEVQKRKYKNKTLEQDKIDKLNELGFIWDVNESLWENGFSLYKSYKEENNGEPMNSNKDLGTWCRLQRRKYKNKTLEQDKIDKLNELGFIWDKKKVYWEEKFKLLKEYIHKNNSIPSQSDPQLGTWCITQRESFFNKTLEQDKIDKLNEIGFIWGDILEQQWETNFNELKKHIKKGAECSNKLKKWMTVQRNLYKDNKLLKNRYDKLNNIGFVWDIKKNNWNNNFLKYKEYYKKNISVTTQIDKKLYNWVNTQKDNFKKKKLTPERIDKLKSVGLDFQEKNDFDIWDKSFNILCEFLEKNNRFPNSSEGVIARWCSTQRTLYNKSKLDDYKVKKLNEIKFVWDIKKNKWDNNYIEVIQFLKENKKIPKEKDSKLGRWLSIQFTQYKKGKLDEDQKVKIKKIIDYRTSI